MATYPPGPPLSAMDSSPAVLDSAAPPASNAPAASPAARELPAPSATADVASSSAASAASAASPAKQAAKPVRHDRWHHVLWKAADTDDAAAAAAIPSTHGKASTGTNKPAPAAAAASQLVGDTPPLMPATVTPPAPALPATRAAGRHRSISMSARPSDIALVSSTAPPAATHWHINPPSFTPTPSGQHRRRIHNDSLLVLQRQYRIDDRPSWETRQQLAERLGMTNREIQVWFQNRRAKERRGAVAGDVQPYASRLLSKRDTERIRNDLLASAAAMSRAGSRADAAHASGRRSGRRSASVSVSLSADHGTVSAASDVANASTSIASSAATSQQQLHQPTPLSVQTTQASAGGVRSRRASIGAPLSPIRRALATIRKSLPSIGISLPSASSSVYSASSIGFDSGPTSAFARMSTTPLRHMPVDRSADRRQDIATSASSSLESFALPDTPSGPPATAFPRMLTAPFSSTLPPFSSLAGHASQGSAAFNVRQSVSQPSAGAHMQHPPLQQQPAMMPAPMNAQPQFRRGAHRRSRSTPHHHLDPSVWAPPGSVSPLPPSAGEPSGQHSDAAFNRRLSAAHASDMDPSPAMSLRTPTMSSPAQPPALGAAANSQPPLWPISTAAHEPPYDPHKRFRAAPASAGPYPGHYQSNTPRPDGHHQLYQYPPPQHYQHYPHYPQDQQQQQQQILSAGHYHSQGYSPIQPRVDSDLAATHMAPPHLYYGSSVVGSASQYPAQDPVYRSGRSTLPPPSSLLAVAEHADDQHTGGKRQRPPRQRARSAGSSGSARKRGKKSDMGAAQGGGSDQGAPDSQMAEAAQLLLSIHS